MKSVSLILALSMLVISCEKEAPKNENPKFEFIEREPILDSILELSADAETEPVDAASGSDAADDPAIWIHPEDPGLSMFYGSNKRGSIVAYDLAGITRVNEEVGRINNIDIAYSLQLENEVIDICGGTNRSTNAIDLYRINPDVGALEYILESPVLSSVDEVYGFCFYHSPFSSKTYAFLCGKDGGIEQYEIIEGGAKLALKLVNSFSIESQPEGLVADHKHGILYIGEENNCIWKVSAEPDDNELSQLGLSSEADNPNIEYDIEGLSIYYTSSDHGYLIASSQGNNSFAIYDRFYDNNYIGSFYILEGAVDRTTETDGIDVMNLSLGDLYPNGVFIAQDDRNINGSNYEPQNFKMVGWEKIANLFDPPLHIDSEFNIREFFD